MSDQDITYATVRFHKSSELQSRVRPDEIQGPRETGHRECSVPWKPIAISLGALGFLLLLTVAVLLTQTFQYSQEKHELQKNLNNLTQKCSTTQNDSYLNEEKLRNMSIKSDALQYQLQLDTLNREERRCYGETKIVLGCSQPTGKHGEEHWFCCGLKCYYFILDDKDWSGCKQTCQACSLSLLKIDDDDELKFLQLQIYPENYWIGLSYVWKEKEWTWIDNGPSKLDLNKHSYHSKIGRCVFLSKTRLEVEECTKSYPCICEKRLDKFHDSLSKNT
ncbi:killer cell lectin-like receptor 5 [Psammomys obesus]|uniref:killer cell lectin-like receptor 5 n=1 Tax=Psammomys obesus TaxID=48139 RepID=UPI0024531894|nr:killer cell lectin-like receptor 5 [Psammomys obesus]